MPVSGLTYVSTIYVLTHTPLSLNSAVATAADVEDARREPLFRMSDGAQSLRPIIQSTVSTDEVGSTSYKDVEPTVITTTYLGTVYTPVVAPQVYSETSFRDVAHTRDQFGGLHEQTLPLPSVGDGWSSGYIDTSDPLLAKEPNNVSNPNRVFVSGVANTGVAFGVPSGIALWRSDDGGQTWANPVKVAENVTPHQYWDKPSLAVSTYSGSLADVYVAYTRFYSDTTAQQEIHVARLTNGGTTLIQDVCAADCTTRGNITGAQIMVDQRQGYLYLIYDDFGSGQVMATSSTNFGQVWSTAQPGSRHDGFDLRCYAPQQWDTCCYSPYGAI